MTAPAICECHGVPVCPTLETMAGWPAAPAPTLSREALIAFVSGKAADARSAAGRAYARSVDADFPSYETSRARTQERVFIGEAEIFESLLSLLHSHEPRQTCGTCDYWPSQEQRADWPEDVGRRWCRKWHSGLPFEWPSDGSGFCHNHAPVDTQKESR